MKRYLLLLALLIAQPALAQNTPETPTAYDLRFWSNGVVPGGTPVQHTLFQKSAITCGQPKIATPVGIVLNPSAAVFDDPDDATKQCVIALDQSKTIFSVPVGQYFATVQAVGATKGATADSPASNPFARAVVPTTPQTPTGLILR